MKRGRYLPAGLWPERYLLLIEYVFFCNFVILFQHANLFVIFCGTVMKRQISDICDGILCL